MTAVERIAKINEMCNVPMMTYKEANEITELRKGLKISDFFRWLETEAHETRCSYERFYKIMGCTTFPGGRYNELLTEAINAGYVKTVTMRKYSRDFRYISLTSKGRNLVFK